MIRPLRRGHWAVMLGLAILLPALLVAAVALRETGPVQRPWPSGLSR